jgi:uncharacterized membrane protein
MAVSRFEAEFGDGAGLTNPLIATAATIGVVVAGAALLEVALIPGLLIGGTAVLAPEYLPKLGRGVRSLLNSGFRRQVEPGVPQPVRTDIQPSFVPLRFTVNQAIAKTITFRIIVTTLDFTVNYVVLGELATAAGLSAFALVAGPLFYLGHETAWNYFGDADRRVDLANSCPSDRAPRRRRTLRGDLRSVVRWPRRSPIAPSRRSWTSRPTSSSSAIS